MLQTVHCVGKQAASSLFAARGVNHVFLAVKVRLGIRAHVLATWYCKGCKRGDPAAPALWNLIVHKALGGAHQDWQSKGFGVEAPSLIGRKHGDGIP